MTALMLILKICQELPPSAEVPAEVPAGVLLLMEATQKAGALDVQVNVVWSVCLEGG